MTGNGLSLVRDLRVRGVRLEAKGGRLVVDAPKGLLSDRDLAQLRSQKSTIIKMLATVAEPDGPRLRCFACRESRFWVSVHGVTVCGICHPPASSNLVARWVGDGDDDGAAS